jgi:acetyl esterase
VDAEIAALLQKVRDAKRTPFWQGTPQQARSGPTLMALLFGPAPDVARVDDFCIDSSNGHALALRLYVPSAAPRGLIVYCHGGGWVLGSVASYHPFTAALAQRTGCAVLSVDYRLAPEHPFPLPLDDARAAMDWAASEAASARIGAPVPRLIAMGDSAGANLMTVAARLHNETNPARRVDLQVLAYPVTDHRFDTGSYVAFAEDHLLTRRDMQWFWDQYLPNATRRDNPLASPLRTPDLSASPATLVLSAGLDPLRDEGEAYGERLRAAGVPTDVVRCEGVVHGFLAMVNFAPGATRAFERVVAAVAVGTGTRAA